MVLPARIFEMKEEASLGLLVQKLKDFREEEAYQKEDGETVKLLTEILDLKLKEDSPTRPSNKDDRTVPRQHRRAQEAQRGA